MYLLKRQHRVTGIIEYACTNGWTHRYTAANYYFSKILARDALNLPLYKPSKAQRMKYKYSITSA